MINDIIKGISPLGLGNRHKALKDKEPSKGQNNKEQFYFNESNNFCKDGKFFIFDEIGDDFPKTIIAPLIREIDEQLEKSARYPIQFFINSPGGDVSMGLELISLFELAIKNQIEIYTYVQADACSCASLIAVCGSQRFVSTRSSHLIHFARGWDYAHNPEMGKRNQQYFEFLQKELVKIYKTKTKLTDIEQKMLADNFRITSGKELIKFGLADHIL